MQPYTSIAVIYNPNSTGNGKQLAQDLKRDLLEHDSKLKVTLLPTKHAGHGETLAYKLAKETKRPLVISASGDGGYHDVINGLMKAQAEGARPVAGLLPAGNANDHYSNVQEHEPVAAIMRQQEQSIDLLKLEAHSKQRPITCYAHSYIGIGLSPTVGRELNKTQLNRFNEIVIVLKTIFVLRPVKIMVAGQARSYDSLIFSNIQKMSKVLNLSKEAKIDDGLFEVTAITRRTKFKLIGSLLRASTVGLNDSQQLKEYTFQTIKPILVQLDGEIVQADAATAVRVSLEHHAIRCII